MDFFANEEDNDSVQVIEVEEIDDKDSIKHIKGDVDYIENDFESEEKVKLKLNF